MILVQLVQNHETMETMEKEKSGVVNLFHKG